MEKGRVMLPNFSLPHDGANSGTILLRASTPSGDRKIGGLKIVTFETTICLVAERVGFEPTVFFHGFNYLIVDSNL